MAKMTIVFVLLVVQQGKIIHYCNDKNLIKYTLLNFYHSSFFYSEVEGVNEESEPNESSNKGQKRKPRHLVDPSNWNKNANIKCRKQGVSYLGTKRVKMDERTVKWDYFIEKSEGKMKPRCKIWFVIFSHW